MNAIFYALIGMLLWGIAPVFGKIGLYRVEPGIALAIRSFVISGFLIGWIFLSGKYATLPSVPISSWLYIGLEGVCASLLGHLAYYYALKNGDVSTISPVMAAFPIVTVLLGFLLLDEKFTANKLAGVLLIVIGVLIIKR